MYFTPDGKSAIVVAEAFKRLDFRDPKTMALQSSLADAAMRRHQPRRLLDRRPLSRSSPASSRRQDDLGEGLTHRSDAQGRRLPASCLPTGRHAAGHPRLARRQALLRRRHDGRRRPRRRRRDVQARSASSRPARARTASIRAATARSSTSPTAARTRSTAAEGQGQRVGASTSRRARST